MGIYRFILALAVILHHSGINIAHYNLGVLAVNSFYLLSGYTMTKLLQKKYVSIAFVPLFYLDRILRIYPLYLVVWLLTGAALVFVQGIQMPFMSRLTFPHFLLNGLIIPTNFYMYLGLEKAMVLPQSWSLGGELLFYLVFPYLFFGRKYVLAIANVTSIGIAFLALVGSIHTEYFGYRLLPGVLFVFLIGSHIGTKNYRLILLNYIYVIFGLIYVFVNNNHVYFHDYNKETYLGLFFGIPVVWLLSKLEISPLIKKVDTALGALSYGMFLNHFLIILLATCYPMVYSIKPLLIYIVISISILFSIFTHLFIERPIHTYRRKLSNRTQV